jgi:hypothetical protein
MVALAQSQNNMAATLPTHGTLEFQSHREVSLKIDIPCRSYYHIGTIETEAIWYNFLLIGCLKYV